jgi:lambda family phage portal protein
MSAHQAASNSDLALRGWNPLPGSADADLLPDLGTLYSRSRDMARNNGLMAGGMQTLRDNIVGATLRLCAMPDYKLLGWTREQAVAWTDVVEPKFRSWAETMECDAAQTLNLMGLTNQALGGALLNGDALALPMWIPRVGCKWNTRMMLVEADRLCTPLGMQYRPDLRGGVEFDSFGAPVAYHVLKQHPGDMFGGLLGVLAGSSAALIWERIPAYTAWGRRQVIHLHDKERTGQSRGKPLVTAVMRDFHMAGKYAGNELQASLANSLVAAFLESNMDQESAAQLFGDDPRAQWEASVGQAQANIRQLKGAAVIPLPAGAKMTAFNPGRPNVAFAAFMENVEQRIAAGMNISRELLLKDFTKSNYSSARATLLEVWRYFLGRRRWLTDYWLKPVYELWLEEAVNAGEVDAPDFYANKYAYCRARFIFGGKGWVDPVKEAQATVLRMGAHLSTLEKECAEQGEDFEEVLDQLAIERQMMIDRGLNPDAVLAATAAAATQQALNEDKAPTAADTAGGDKGAAGGADGGNDGDENGAQSNRAFRQTAALLAGAGAAA